MQERTEKRKRIPREKRLECLKCFREGVGYKRTATITGLNRYTVRDYRRRYAHGDISWAERPCDKMGNSH